MINTQTNKQNPRPRARKRHRNAGFAHVRVFVFVAILLLLPVAYYLYITSNSCIDQLAGQPAEQAEKSTSITADDSVDTVSSVEQSMASGNYESASRLLKEMTQDDTVDPEQRARAVLNAAEAEYKMTGEIEDAVSGIRELKKSVLDNSTSPKVRAESLISMAGIYYGSAGRHPLVFEEIFEGEPFSQYRVEGEGYKSIHQLQEWAYEMHPTANSALKLAQWYVVEPFQNDSLTEEEVREYVAEARRYLNESRVLEQEQLANGELETSGRRYVSNRYWTAFIRAGVTYLAEDPSELDYPDYRNNYDELIVFLDNYENPQVRAYIPYTHWLYANWLVMFDNDTEAARDQLARVNGFMRSVPQPENTEFGKFVANTPVGESEYVKEENFFTSMIVDMAALDENFRALVGELNPGLVENL